MNQKTKRNLKHLRRALQSKRNSLELNRLQIYYDPCKGGLLFYTDRFSKIHKLKLREIINYIQNAEIKRPQESAKAISHLDKEIQQCY